MPSSPSCLKRPWCLVLLLACGSSLWAQPTVTRSVPGGLNPGAATEVQLLGTGLDAPLKFWTSFPATIELLEQKADQVRCKITLPADAPLGLGGLVVASPAGAIDPFWLMVDDLPSAAEAGNNQTIEGAQALTLPVAVDGNVDGTGADYYRLELKTGQRITVEVYASRLASTCDPVVRLLDAVGRELAYVDDDASWGADCKLSFTAQQDGPHLIEVRDNKYQSGPKYRLRVGDFPATATSYPLGARRGSTSLLTFPTTSNDTIVPQPMAVGDDAPGTVTVAARSSQGQAAAIVRVAVGDLPEYVEHEPNQDLASALRIATPCAVNGILQDDGDLDSYQFAASKDQRLVFQTTTRSLGSPAYPYLRLYDANDKLLAESPVADVEEFSFAHTFAADGVYRLTVEELTRRSGPEFTYRVEITGRPFSLVLKNVKESQYKLTTPAANGCYAIDIQCQRTGYDGPITLTWSGVAPDGQLKLYNATIPAKAAEHRLYVAVGTAQAAGDLLVGNLEGRAAVNGQDYAARVGTISVVQLRTPGMVLPPLWHDGLFFLAATAAADPFFKVSADVPRVALPAAGGSATVTLTLERVNAEFKEAPAIVTTAVPDGLTLESKVEGDKVTLTLKNAAGLPAGERVVSLGVYGTLKGRNQLVPLDVTVEIPAGT